MGPIESMAKPYAIKIHKKVNQKYGSHPYDYHLALVRFFAMKFIYLIPEEDQDAVLAGCWVHDIIEDGRETYNDVKAICGELTAELAYALTNEKGKTRADRANAKYYDEMRLVPYACFIKICDRLANAYESICVQKSSMGKKYFKEHSKFALLIQEPKNKFFQWVFQSSETRMNPIMKFIFGRIPIKYEHMWKELDVIFLDLVNKSELYDKELQYS